MYKEVIYLISTTETVDQYGDTITVPVEREVFADKLTYRNKAFYQAMASGLKPQATYAIMECEYNGEKAVKCDGKEHTIIDVTPLKNYKIGLIIEGDVNVGT